MRERHYPSDTTDAEWAVLEPLLPVPACKLPTGGRAEAHPRRNVVDAIRYVNDNGVKWRAVPVGFGIPWRTVYGFFQWWRATGDLARLHAELHEQVRVHDGINPRTVAVILDSQPVKGAETVGADTRGFDGGKLINGRKRHLAVDMRGMPLAVMVTPAAPHDSVPARDQLFRLRLTRPELTVAWADSAYGGTLVDPLLPRVPRRKDQDGFAVLAKRWRVERAISWIMRARRNVRDYERLISHSEAHLTWTFITLMVRRLTLPPRAPRTSSHPVEPVKTVGKPTPIRFRTQKPQSIRLAPTTLR
ncbi:IS5 family transposase [Streptomyces sp. YU58]|uniref:IS5 family transposase n=1 Tax=Streptomyces sp. SX92 TaxID=3158972 RepID=UPI0027B96F39|nr:IS5 family transposase [Streptomyces coralus]WLW58267.1 IS5 family transposase [Streptomyces coralus]